MTEAYVELEKKTNEEFSHCILHLAVFFSIEQGIPPPCMAGLCVLGRSNSSKRIKFRFLSKTCLSDLVGGIKATDTAGGDETQSGDSRQVGTYKKKSRADTLVGSHIGEQMGHCECYRLVKKASSPPPPVCRSC